MEIEVRATIDDFANLESKIREQGATFIKEKQQADIYFGETCLYEKTGYSFMLL